MKSKNLLVVVDMVNGFVNCGALADKNIDKITPNIENLIKRALDNNVKIVAFKDCHSENDIEFETFPPHCIKGTVEAELIPQLKKYEDKMLVINKNTTNGFVTDTFLSLVKKVEFDNVYVTGCCTDICVESFVTSYINYIKENKLNTHITVFNDACYTFNGENHNAEKEHNNAIIRMKNLGAQIKNVKSCEYTKE